MFYSLLRFQHFLESLYQALISLFRVFLRFRFRSDLNRLGPDSGELFILANGPSLREELDLHAELLAGKSLMCVNQFALSEDYAKIRPQHYVLLDIGFFVEKNKLRFF